MLVTYNDVGSVGSGDNGHVSQLLHSVHLVEETREHALVSACASFRGRARRRKSIDLVLPMI